MPGVKWIPLIAGLIVVLASGLRAEELTILTEEMPPYNYTGKDGQAAGFSTEIVKNLMHRTGIGITGGRIQVLPWTRAYRRIEAEKNILLYTMTRSEKRENRFKWVGPIASRTIWFWKLKRRKDIVVKSIEGAKKYKVGGVVDFSSVKYLQELGFDLDLCSSEELNFKKLLANRFELLTALELAAAYHMNKQGKSFTELERLVRLDDRYDYYLALNIDTSDEIVTRLQNALDEAKKDGTFEIIKNLYLK